ncbi:hypothetical protein D6821_00460 [Candidatus Parcubacteria bacterium]|nr:MAG: hypothetical protein D6821_00460 [Candidatus Parcubacteria bacterium]
MLANTKKSNLLWLLWAGGGLLSLGLLMAGGFWWWQWSNQPLALEQELSAEIQAAVKQDFLSLPVLAMQEGEKEFRIEDNLDQAGIEIEYPRQQKSSAPKESKEKGAKGASLSLVLPKDFQQGIKVQTSQGKVVIKSLDKRRFKLKPLARQQEKAGEQESFWRRLLPPSQKVQYLKYQSQDNQKSLYYAYQKDGATGQRKLKEWIVYERPQEQETETYLFENAILRLDEFGNIEVRSGILAKAKRQRRTILCSPQSAKRLTTHY